MSGTVVDGGANQGGHSRRAGTAGGSPPAARRGMGLAAAALLWFSAAAGRGEVVTNLTGYWSFNSTSGATTEATAGPNGALTTVSGSPFVANTTGVIGNSLDFVSTQPSASPLRQGYVNYGTSVAIQSTMSIAGWMNIDTVLQATNGGVVRAYLLGQMGNTAESRATQLHVSGNGSVTLSSYVSGTGSFPTTAEGIVPIGTNAWTHIAATRISGTQRIYVDGILRASGTQTGSFVVASSLPLASGLGFATFDPSPADQVNYLDARLDDLGLWSKELTSREVAAIAGLGKRSAVPLDSAQINQVLALESVGQSAVAGSDTWYYTSTFVNPFGGGSLLAGMNYVGTDNEKYIILQGTENNFVGVTTLVPEPQGLLFAGLGVAAAAWAGRRRRS